MQGMPLRDINHATSAKQALDVSPLPEQVVIGSGQCKQGLVIRHIAGKTLYAGHTTSGDDHHHALGFESRKNWRYVRRVSLAQPDEDS